MWDKKLFQTLSFFALIFWINTAWIPQQNQMSIHSRISQHKKKVYKENERKEREMKSLPSKYESVMQRKRFKQQWKQVKDEKKEKATKKIRTMSHFSFFFHVSLPFSLFLWYLLSFFLCGLNLRFFIFCGKSRKSIFFLSALNPVESYPVSCDFFLYPQSDTNRTKLFF